jgi:hypothetical protein
MHQCFVLFLFSSVQQQQIKAILKQTLLLQYCFFFTIDLATGEEKPLKIN